MPEDLNTLLNAELDGRLTPAQAARLELRLKRPATARRLARLRALRGALRAGAPSPSAEQSRRMWKAVAARCAAEAVPVPAAAATHPAEREGWFAFLSRPWIPAWGAGLGAAAAVLALAFLIHPHPRPDRGAGPALPSAASAPAPAVKAAAPVLALADGAARPRRHAAILGRRVEALALAPSAPVPVPVTARAAVAPVPVLAGLPVPAAPADVAGETEVERALSDSQSDALISQFMRMRPQAQVPVVAMMSPSPDAVGGPGGTEDTVAYQQSAAPVLQDLGSGVSGVARGGKDANGYWDWTPAAQSLNQRDWGQARTELQAAADKAGSAAERAFADSALGLLAAAGGPLEGSQPLLPAAGGLRVLGAGTWQLLVDSRLARFGGGVAVRLPGLREDGDSFLLDLGFNRGELSPGSHFVRVSGETAARVVDASGQPVPADDFYAPSGADYDIAAKVLRLR